MGSTGDQVLVGIDIGTTSVKAVAVDVSGRVVAQVRIPHVGGHMTGATNDHDADAAWRASVVDALHRVAVAPVAAVNVAAMVPSLVAVDGYGRAVSPGLIYGDSRAGAVVADPSSGAEAVAMLSWLAEHHPDAAGFWPAQAVAGHALCGVAAVGDTVAYVTLPRPEHGADVASMAEGRLPHVVRDRHAIGSVTEAVAADAGHAVGAVVGAGTIDAYAEQLVSGAEAAGDVLVVLGATALCWILSDDEIHVDGMWTVPHHRPGVWMVGGASNAGGMLVDWARGLVGEVDAATQPDDVPVCLPYLRGERVIVGDPTRRASLHDLDVSHGSAAIWRAAHEATGHVIRRQIETSGCRAERLVIVGGGSADASWVQAIVDVVGRPASVAADPFGAARGAALLAARGRFPADAVSYETPARTVEPDPAWAAAASRRYRRFLELHRGTR